jgi:uncharacterized protein (TIGR03435 family)
MKTTPRDAPFAETSDVVYNISRPSRTVTFTRALARQEAVTTLKELPSMRALICLVLLSTAALAQPGAAPKFVVADVHPNPHSSIPVVRGPFFGDDRYEMRFATLVDLIHTAFGLDAERVYGGPSWIEYDRFDVLAIAPKGSTAESRKLMLQSLLADRFKMTFHNDSKPMAAYKLTAAKSNKLQESSGGDTGCKFSFENQVPPGPPPPPGEGGRQEIQLPTLVYACKGTTMAAFAGALGGVPAVNQYLDNKIVVDQTELPGNFDFTLRYTPKAPAGMAIKGEVLPLFDALDKQLGLKLELTTTPLPVIVVDGAVEKPTENSPEVAKSFPPTPTEFDVAEIKPSPAGSQGRNVQPEIKNGRVIVPGMTLQNIIWLAWDITPNDEIVGAPKWLNDDRFDLIAKAPDGVALGDMTPTSSRSISVNIDALRPMLRTLLVQRFKMQVHMEDRPTPRYTLTAAKPKLQKADPNGRTKWTEGPAADGKDPRNANPVLGRLVTCHNMSMAQFAKLLQEIAPGYIHNEVVDATGLEGNWDFTFNFSGIGQLQGGGKGDGPPGAPGGADSASDPTGALSLLDALPKQLGLKLEMQKHPLPVLVIDHVEQKPTDN